MYSIAKESFLSGTLMTLMAEYELPIHLYVYHRKCHSGTDMCFSVVSNRIRVVGVGGKLCFWMEGFR